MENETLLRNFMLAWQERDWNFVENALAEGFSFTSLYDDHLDKGEYKQRCWDSIEDMEGFEIITLMARGDELFVRYKGRVNGTSVQNTEHIAFRNGRIKEITVFFGRPDDASQSAEKQEK